MEHENNEFFDACGSKSGGCNFQSVGESLSCVPGRSNCQPVSLLEAEESAFHDAQLVHATKAIKDILAQIPQDANGRNLSFLHTNMGTLLAWVEHGGTAIDGAITSDDDDATVAAALKLKNVTSVGAAY
jgi:hypothetical protein